MFVCVCVFVYVGVMYTVAASLLEGLVQLRPLTFLKLFSVCFYFDQARQGKRPKSRP